MSETPPTRRTPGVRRRGLAALAIAALALSLTACGTNGRTMGRCQLMSLLVRLD